MHYLIDGYNLLFRLLHKGEEVQKARELMIRELALKISFTDLNATLVFDSKYQKGEMSFRKEGSLHIVYTDEGETADDWIIDTVKRSLLKGAETVVTTDKRLASQVRIKGGLSIPCEEFMAYLHKKVRQQNKANRDKKFAEESEKIIPKPPAEKKKSLLKERIVKSAQVYYEEIFEQNYLNDPENQKAIEREKEKEIKAKEIAAKRPTKRITPNRDKLDGESDLDRWSRLFGA